jgi:hypothetical protein
MGAVFQVRSKEILEEERTSGEKIVQYSAICFDKENPEGSPCSLDDVYMNAYIPITEETAERLKKRYRKLAAKASQVHR